MLGFVFSEKVANKNGTWTRLFHVTLLCLKLAQQLTLFESDPNSLSFLPSIGSTFDIMSPRAKLADGPSSSLGGTSSVKI